MTLTLTEIERALRASWAEDTCSADDLERYGWQPDNPSRGHCDITALIVHDLFGGEFVMASVHVGGDQRGFHNWNRLDCGIEIDLTREQFKLGETLTVIKVVQRPPGVVPKRDPEYQLLKQRFLARLR